MGRCSDAKDRLLATTARLLHERGYEALSVADICADAGLKKGSFYHFFPSKRDLVLETIDKLGHRQLEMFSVAAATPGTARERLVQLLRTTAKGLRATECEGRICGCPLGNLALEMAVRDEQIRARVSRVFDGWRTVVLSLLSQGIERGEFSLEAPETVATSIVAYWQGATMLAKAANDPDVFESLVPGVLYLLDGAAVVEERLPVAAP